MIAELIGPDDARWRRLLEVAPHDVYDLPGFGPLYEKDPQAREVALHVQGEGAELLLPLMLKPLPPLGDPSLSGWWDASSPYGYPGLVVRGALSPAEVERLPDRVSGLLREHRILTCFLRGSPLLPEGDRLLERLGATVLHCDAPVIELQRSGAEIWGDCSATHRRQLRRMQERGYSVQIDEWAHYPAFMALYRETMQRVGARPFFFFDGDYFGGLKRVLGDRLHLISVLAPDGTVASAGLVTACGGLLNAHLNGASSAHFHTAPGRMLHDATWRWAKQRGNQVLNYGPGTGREDDPLIAFKRSFATGSRPYRTVRAVSDQRLYQRACAAAGTSDEEWTGFFPAYRQARVEPSAPARVPPIPARAERAHESVVSAR